MFICANCSFANARRLLWSRHQTSTGHSLQQSVNTDESAKDISDSDDTDIVMFSENPLDVSHESLNHALVEPPSDDEEELEHNLADATGEQNPDTESPPGEHLEPWFPWMSRVHFYLTVLYHGSHRRNIDQVTLKVIMDILKIYVPLAEYFPTFREVADFKFEHWESKIFESRVEDGNVFSFLHPGIIAMRLANPVLSKSFDRVPRKSSKVEITSQISAEKFKTFEYRKLGNFLQGDVIKLSKPGKITMEGYVEKVQCQLYFQVEGFYIEGNQYSMTGKFYFHSSLPEMNYLRDRVNDTDCFIQIKNLVGDLVFDKVCFKQTLRFQNQQARFSKFRYDESTPPVLYQIPTSDLTDIQNSLTISERDACVQVVTNLHIDDASQVQSKMWKSASVCDIQFAGTPAGMKGNEHNNVILSLTDTSKISLKRLFEGIGGEFQRLSSGFHCFDSFSGQVELVKAPIAAVLCDLPAKAEITPFTGFQADVFCPRDMYNKRTDTGLDRRRYLDLLRGQIRQINNETTAAAKKRLGVRFGLDVNNLETVLDNIEKFLQK